jgi:hypothetical protein
LRFISQRYGLSILICTRYYDGSRERFTFNRFAGRYGGTTTVGGILASRRGRIGADAGHAILVMVTVLVNSNLFLAHGAQDLDQQK